MDRLVFIVEDVSKKKAPTIYISLAIPLTLDEIFILILVLAHIYCILAAASFEVVYHRWKRRCVVSAQLQQSVLVWSKKLRVGWEVGGLVGLWPLPMRKTFY